MGASGDSKLAQVIVGAVVIGVGLFAVRRCVLSDEDKRPPIIREPPRLSAPARMQVPLAPIAMIRLAFQGAVITPPHQAAQARAQTEAAQKDAARLLADRQQLAPLLEQGFLEDGMDTTVSLRGKARDVLRVRYIFCGRVWINDFMNHPDEHGVTHASILRLMGFRRVECTDGYDEEWTFDL